VAPGKTRRYAGQCRRSTPAPPRVSPNARRGGTSAQSRRDRAAATPTESLGPCRSRKVEPGAPQPGRCSPIRRARSSPKRSLVRSLPWLDRAGISLILPGSVNEPRRVNYGEQREHGADLSARAEEEEHRPAGACGRIRQSRGTSADCGTRFQMARAPVEPFESIGLWRFTAMAAGSRDSWLSDGARFSPHMTGRCSARRRSCPRAP
jgi:hypothetical protein